MKCVEMARNYRANRNGSFPSALTAVFGESDANTVSAVIEAQKAGTTDDITRFGWGLCTFALSMTNPIGAWAGSYLLYTITRDTGTGDEQEIVVPFKGSDLAPASGARPKLLLVLRGSGTAASPTFYALAIDIQNDSAELIKVVAGVRTVLATATGLAFAGTTTDNAFTIARFKVEGTALSARFWNYDCDQPSSEGTAWNLSSTDSAIASGSKRGFGLEKNGATDTCAISSIHFVSVVSWAAGATAQSAPVPRTAVQRRTYFEGSNNTRLCLKLGVVGELSGSPGTAQVGWLTAATSDFATQSGDDPADTSFPALINSVGNHSTRMNEQFTGESTVGIGAIGLVNENGALDDWMQYNIAGQKVELYLGGTTWPWYDYERVYTGIAQSLAAAGSGGYTLSVGTAASLASLQLAQTTYASASGMPAANVGKVKPMLYGICFNVPAVLIDTATNKYQIHGYGAVSAITAVRENGNAITGTATINLADGTFTLSGTPSGDITVDARNEEAVTIDGVSVTPSTVAKIARVIAAQHTELGTDRIVSWDYMGRDGWDALGYYTGNADAGIYINSVRDFKSVLDELVLSASGGYGFNRNDELYVSDFIPPARNASISGIRFYIAEANVIVNTLYPSLRIEPAEAETLIVRKNWFQQSTFAGAVTAANRELYQSVGTRSTYAPSYSGLTGNPQQHALRRSAKERITLLSASSTTTARTLADDVVTSEYESYKYPWTVYTFQTQRHALDLFVGAYLNLTHSRFGFSSGAWGRVVGVDRNPKTCVATVQLLVIETESNPTFTAAYPYAGSEYYS